MPHSDIPFPSRLNRGQRLALKAVMALGVFMLANTLYLLCFRLADRLGIGVLALTETSLPRFYQAMLLAHPGVGLLLTVGTVGFALWHLGLVWGWRRNRPALISGFLVVGLGVTLAVSGLFILTESNSLANRWVFRLHVSGAILAPALYLLHRRASSWKPSPGSYRLIPSLTLGLTALILALHALTYTEDELTAQAMAARAAGTHLGPGAKARQLTSYADQDGFLPANYVPPDSPFFPAATTTTTGGYLPLGLLLRGEEPPAQRLADEVERYGFVAEEWIGARTCARCHADIAAQWATSAHRFASFNNPFYEAAIENLRTHSNTSNPELEKHLTYHPELEGKEGRVKSKWCAGCHDPALLLTGEMNAPFDRASVQAQAGLTCMACHAIDALHGRTGNADYNIADERQDPYLFSQTAAGLGRLVHDTVLKARPTVHRRQMLKPFFRTSEFCATCHKVSLDTRLNDYRWLRGQNEYDNWHDSGVAHNAARTFYLPPEKQGCQDCHMPLEPAVRGDVSAKKGYVRSHRFLAVNTALPHVRGDQETIRRIESFLQDEKLRIEAFAARLGPDFQELAVPLESASLPAGQEVQVDVVVRNLGVGHTFPGGTTDSNEGWLEFAVLDRDGRPVAVSGFLQDDGQVDPGAHFYKALLVDRHGQAILKRNVQDIHTAVYTRVIDPGTADVARYRFQVPAATGESLTVRVRLLWRKFNRPYTEFAYHTLPEGFRRFAAVPELPITEIARHQVHLPVTEPEQVATAISAPPQAADWQRYNDYGIGLLLQGETRMAAWAFRQVAEAAPERVDGARNLARVAVREGDLQAAFEYLRRGEELAPGDARNAWVWAVALQREGRYQAAAAAYLRVLEDFPQDRAAWRNLGRVRYLDGQFETALGALDQALAIDPEDAAAHFHRMLALQALDRQPEARVAEKAYREYQLDESAREATRAYLLAHPEDEREAQAIHVHYLQHWERAGKWLAGER